MPSAVLKAQKQRKDRGLSGYMVDFLYFCLVNNP